MTPFQFYFDFASPYGSIAAMQVERVDPPIVWRPFLLLGKVKPFPIPPGAWEARPGLLQHGVAGTGFPQAGTMRRRWWRLWR